MNILIAKAYRTTPSEALCILAGTTQIFIQSEQAAKHYDVLKWNRANIKKIDVEILFILFIQFTVFLFDAAWWPVILNGLSAYDCPNNFLN